jgi:hypothetical protein
MRKQRSQRFLVIIMVRRGQARAVARSIKLLNSMPLHFDRPVITA